MLHIGKMTNQPPGEIIDEAIAYFGPGGAGLDVQSRGPNSVGFTGGGGFVLVQVAPKDEGKKTEVDIQSREWDYDVRRFLRRV